MEIRVFSISPCPRGIHGLERDEHEAKGASGRADTVGEDHVWHGCEVVGPAHQDMSYDSGQILGDVVGVEPPHAEERAGEVW